MTDTTLPTLDGRQMGAYLAVPDKTPAPALIMIQEIFGVNAEMREKCDQMAKLGYIAICPDLFWRIEPDIQLVDSKPDQLERAFELFGEFDVDKGIEDLKATLEYIRGYAEGNGKVGCTGYCLGGKLAYMMATRTDIDASVGYYGVGIENMLDEAGNIHNPLLLHLAEQDEFVPSAAQKMIRAEFQDRPLVSVYSYPDVDHAFARHKGLHYNKPAAELANDRTFKFLDEHLKEPAS